MALKLSPRDQLIAVGLGSLVLVALAIFLVLRPQFSYLGTLAVEQKVEQGKLDEAILKLQRLDAIRQEAAQTEAKRILLSRRLPENAEQESLIIELNKLANAADIELASVDFGSVTQQSGYAEMPVTLAASGTFYSVVDFLYRLEKMTREVLVDDFSLSPSAYPDLQIDINARTFKAAAAAAVPAPGAPPAAPAAPAAQ